MKKTSIIFVAIASILMLSACDKDNAKYVNTFIGTGGNGHTYPGVVAPFGMVQPSPETGNVGWEYCSGYVYDDNRIISFGQTHLSGTGCPDSGDGGFMPFCATDKFTKKDYSSAFKKENEKSQLGLYSVILDDAKCKVSLTASERVGLYDVEFFEDGGSLYFDFQSAMFWGKDKERRVKSSSVKLLDDYTLVATQNVKAFTARDINIVIKFNKPVKKMIDVERPTNYKGQRIVLQFGLKKGESLKIKTAISTVSVDGALKNLATLDTWDLQKTASQTRAKWNEILSKIDIDATPEQKEIFYTALYHSFISPNNIADVDGKYRGGDSKIAQTSNASKRYFTNLSLWDTYRAVIPLTSILKPDVLPEIVNSMLEHFDAVGVLPTNEYWGKETWCMIGNHSISVIAGCIQRGQKGFNYERAFNAMLSSSTKDHNKSKFSVLEKYGYYPFDLCNPESVSKTLENCYGDYCLSESAKVMGKKDVAEHFAKRASFYKNIFDVHTGFMRGKDSKGKWRKPFNPFEYSHAETFGGDYTEGNAWQYNFHVQHDIAEFIKLFGGREKFVEMLDNLFSAQDTRKAGTFKKSSDVTGFVGQYAHGNEPSHHVAYLYTLAGRRDRTAEIVSQICNELYTNKPDGLCGNDDCGQMSAWYVFSSLGFYPVNPNGLEYVIGAPQIKGAVLHLENGKKFEMVAHNISKENKYVKSVKFNGKEYKADTLSHSDILKGGKIEFFMGKK